MYGLTNHIITQADRLFPGTFTPFFLATAGVGALMHDVGRSQGGKDHDKTGALITDQIGPLRQTVQVMLREDHLFPTPQVPKEPFLHRCAGTAAASLR